MPNLQQLIGEEIRRLARKELKAAVEPLKAQIVSLKKTVAEQNKRIQAIEKCGAASAPREQKTSVPSTPETSKTPRITPERIKRIREKLSLNQVQFAALLDVSIHSVNRWEAGTTVPRSEQKKRIAAIRDMGKRELAPILQAKGISERQTAAGTKLGRAFDHAALTAFREAHKLTKVQLAALLGVSQFSVGHWESGRSEPRDAQKTKISALLLLSDDQLQVNLKSLSQKTNGKQVVSNGKDPK